MIGIGREGPLGPARDAVPGSGTAVTRRARAHSPGPAASEPLPRPLLAERDALAVLASVNGVGPLTLARLVAGAGSASRVVDHAVERRRSLLLSLAASPDGRTMSGAVVDELVRVSRAWESVLRRLEVAGVTLVTLEDADYPARLRAIELPPHVLFVQGERRALSLPRAVAVVGTRRPSDAGRLIAGRIASAVASAGAAVVSGLAVGIDGAAHAAAVTVQGTTVAVLGGGHARLFPAAHRRLAATIAAGGGAVVSELPPDASATRGTFPRRNRIISGLSEATVVVEAGARSGALLTAQWTLEQGRECFVVPGTIDSPTSAGCLSFLREAAGAARVVAGIPQLLDDLDLVSTASAGHRATVRSAELAAVPAQVADALLGGRATVDELVAETRLPVASVLAALTMLESRGLVVDAYGRYRPAGVLVTRTPHARAGKRPPRGSGEGEG